VIDTLVRWRLFQWNSSRTCCAAIGRKRPKLYKNSQNCTYIYARFTVNNRCAVEFSGPKCLFLKSALQRSSSRASRGRPAILAREAPDRPGRSEGYDPHNTGLVTRPTAAQGLAPVRSIATAWAKHAFSSGKTAQVFLQSASFCREPRRVGRVFTCVSDGIVA
jgi:hypothetical protein